MSGVSCNLLEIVLPVWFAAAAITAYVICLSTGTRIESLFLSVSLMLVPVAKISSAVVGSDSFAFMQT